MSKTIMGGVAKYIWAEATVQVHFPVDFKGREFVSCRYCPYYVTSTRKCALNGTVPEYPDDFVGSLCPLELIDEDEKENENHEGNEN